jgi:hypothetical protein
MSQKNTSNQTDHPGSREEASHLSHLPPALNKARVEQAKQVEADIGKQEGEEPVQQMREGRRKRRRSTS